VKIIDEIGDKSPRTFCLADQHGFRETGRVAVLVSLERPGPGTSCSAFTLSPYLAYVRMLYMVRFQVGEFFVRVGEK